MRVLAILGATGVTVIYLYHLYRTKQQQQTQPIYYGAPAWPAMNPTPVPQIAYPPGFEAMAVRFGVPSTQLEAYTK